MNKIDHGARLLLGVVGVGLLVTSVFMTYFPPDLKQMRPECPETGECTATVDEMPEAIILAIVALGGLLILFAGNGRALASVEVGGNKASFLQEALELAETAAADLEGDEGGEGEPDTVVDEQQVTLKVGGKDVVVVPPEKIPPRVLSDLVAHGRDEGEALSGIQFAMRRAGKGNHPWIVKPSSGPALKVSYGGRGKPGATVTKVK